MFEDIDSGTLIIYGIIALAVCFLIIYWAVLAGTSDQRKIMRIQTKLLENIARKLGITEEEIEKSYKINEPKNPG